MSTAHAQPGGMFRVRVRVCRTIRPGANRTRNRNVFVLALASRCVGDLRPRRADTDHQASGHGWWQPALEHEAAAEVLLCHGVTLVVYQQGDVDGAAGPGRVLADVEDETWPGKG